MHCTVLCCVAGDHCKSALPPPRLVDTRLHCTVLYCTVLHCTVLNFIVWVAGAAVDLLYHHRVKITIDTRHCTVLCCVVLYFIVLYCIVLFCIVLYYMCGRRPLWICCTIAWVRSGVTPHCTVLYCTALYCTVLYCMVCVAGGHCGFAVLSPGSDQEWHLW